jgi:hypothetical protein
MAAGINMPLGYNQSLVLCNGQEKPPFKQKHTNRSALRISKSSSLVDHSFLNCSISTDTAKSNYLKYNDISAEEQRG